MRTSKPRCLKTQMRSAMLLALLIVPLTPNGIPAQASEPDKPISIGSVTANPQANNRRMVLFKGKANDIRMISGTSVGISTCGQAFTLADDTGSIDVWYIIKCHHQENGHIVVVGENDQVLVAGTIDASPPTDVQMSKRPDIGVRAMATKVVRLKP